MNRIYSFILSFSFLLVFLPSFVFADTSTTTTVSVRVETSTDTLFDRPVESTDCIVDGATYPSTKAICVLVNAGLAYEMQFGFLTSVAGVSADASNSYWSVRINYQFADFGLLEQDVHAGDEFVLSLVRFDDWVNAPGNPLGLIQDTSGAAEYIFQTMVFDDGDFFTHTDDQFIPFEHSTTIWINGVATSTDSSGKITLFFEQPGTYEIKAEYPGYTRSKKYFIEISKKPNVLPIPVTIESLGKTLFQKDVTVTSTTFMDSSGSTHTFTSTTALGILAEAARNGDFELSIVNSSFGFYVSSVFNQKATGFDGWTYKINGVAPFVGMNDISLQGGDVLNVSYAVWPYKLEVEKTEVVQNIPLQFTAFTYDASSTIWNPSPSTTLQIGNDFLVTNASGSISYAFSATGTFFAHIWNTDFGFSNSPSVTITVIEASSTTPAQNPIAPAAPSASPGTSTNPLFISSFELHQRATLAINYLRQQQQTNGAIQNAGVSAWATIAFGSGGIYSQEIMNNSISLIDFLNTYTPLLPTDMERQLMAYSASGITSSTLVQRLKSTFSDKQFGDPELLNDDIFAILALLAVGEDANQSMIVESLAGIESNWSATSMGVDLTAAYIQMLEAYKKAGGVRPIDIFVQNAKNYLAHALRPDGGFGPSSAASYSSTDSTAWVVQAILSMGEDPNSWIYSSSTPYTFLLANQNSDGGFGKQFGGTSEIWTTAYVIPALLKKVWPIMLPLAATPSLTSPHPVAGSGDITTTSSTIAISPSALPSASPTVQTPDISIPFVGGPPPLEIFSPIIEDQISQKTKTEIVSSPVPNTQRNTEIVSIPSEKVDVLPRVPSSQKTTISIVQENILKAIAEQEQKKRAAAGTFGGFATVTSGMTLFLIRRFLISLL